MPREVWFVLVLVIVLSASLQHAHAVLAAGSSPRNVRSRLHLALNLSALIASFALFPATIIWHTWGFLFLVPAGFAIALRNMVYASKTAVTPAESQREYLISLAGGGVVFLVGLAVLFF